MSKHRKYNFKPSDLDDFSEKLKKDYKEGIDQVRNTEDLEDAVSQINTQLQHHIRQRMSSRSKGRRNYPQFRLIFLIATLFVLLLIACLVYYVVHNF